MVSGAEMVEKPTISYEDVAGLDEQVESVREAIELPLIKPELFEKVGIVAAQGRVVGRATRLREDPAGKSGGQSDQCDVHSNGGQ